MRIFNKYRLRLERKRRRIRAIRRGTRDLQSVVNRTALMRSDNILLFCTLKNERIRLPFFLSYYRELGVNHFFIIDNGSTDGSAEYLRPQTDISLWRTEQSYKRGGFGVHWMNYLKNRYADGHWCLVVDVDEFFVFPHCDIRPITALTDWLDASSIRSFGALLLDMYPKENLLNIEYKQGDDPILTGPYFDSGNYSYRLNPIYGNLWIQGGVRQRVFFPNKPEFGPALNKIPLVKWRRGHTFVSSTHTILPRSLNVVYDQHGGQRASGCLLHTKFAEGFYSKVTSEDVRVQHYAAGREYDSYLKLLKEEQYLYTPQSQKYSGWRQLENLGLMSRGGWS